MRNSKFFIIILFVVAGLLAFINIPVPINLGEHNVPLINQKVNLNFDSSKFNFRLGPINLQKDISYRLGLDLQGGTSFTYQVDMTDITEENRQDAFEGARNIIERRVNLFGTTEPNIQSIRLPNDYRIVVELPGATNADEAISLIGQTAKLSFWEEGDEPLATEEASLYPLFMDQIFQNKPLETGLTGSELESAKVVYGSADGTPQVQLNFNSQGAGKFAEITGRNIGKPVVITLDNSIVSFPVVQQAILDGKPVISGGFMPEEAKSLAIQLNSDALPAPLNLIGQTTIGPTLGIESLQKSLVGGLVGFISIFIFMVFMYKKEGLLAFIALLIYTIIILFIFKFIPITLTLAGIAGLILSIGMAVDANVLIFERMREELRSGKPRKVAIALGFSRAWASIRDSNITTLITTAILFYFGTGIVRGFAVALGIGVLVSMFSAIIVTRSLVEIFGGKEK